MPLISAETKKQRLVAALVDARSQVLQAALAVPPASLDLPFLGVWSVHDLLAHLIGWDYANLEAIGAVRSGCLPAFYAAYDPGWRSFNAVLVRRHKQASAGETLARVATSHQALVDALAAVPASDFTHDFGVRSPGSRRITIGMLVQAEAGDERKHAEQIRGFSAASSGK